MIDDKTGGPAFPLPGHVGYGDAAKGMSLRDYFAATIDLRIFWDNVTVTDLEGICGERGNFTDFASKAAWWAKAESAARYLVADAMLQQRSKTDG